MSARPGRSSASAGFTLIELLVASVILSLVALLMFNAMRFVQRATATAESRREAVESTVTGLGLVRATLARATPMFKRVDNKDYLVFEGSDDHVRFATFEPDYIPGWPLVGYDYSIALDGGRYLLEVRRATLNPAAPDLAALDQAEPRALLSFASPAKLSYFGALRDKDPGQWRPDWPDGDFLPQAVRIGPDGGDPGWPDFVMPLALNTPAACMAPSAKQTRGCPK